LLLSGNNPELAENNYTSLPKNIEISPEATMILEYAYANNIQITETSDETKYYATEYYKPIVGNQTLFFDINDVATSQFGEATLRIGIGREHGRELFPEVKINGSVLQVDKKYRGDDQKDRLSFFGVLEVNIPWNLLQKNNNVSIKFPDSGGFISSLSLQAYRFSKDIKRFQTIATGVQKLDETGLRIFPNPAQSEIYLETPFSEKINRVEIYSATGSLVKRSQDVGQNQRLSVKELPNGLYTLMIFSESGRLCHKLLISR